MNKQLICGAMLVTLASSPLMAANFSYNYAEIGVSQVEVDSEDADGVGIRGSFEFSPGLVGELSYNKIEYDRFDIDQDALGIFFGGLLNQGTTSTKLGVFYQDGSIEIGPFDLDTKRYGVSADLRAWLVENSLEGTVGIAYGFTEVENDDDDGAALRAGIRGYLTPAISIGLEVERDTSYGDDIDTLTLTGRFNF